MTSITREDREQRIARDDGDPDDQVWIGAGEVYHSRICQSVHRGRPDFQVSTRAGAHQRWRGPCKACKRLDDEVTDERCLRAIEAVARVAGVAIDDLTKAAYEATRPVDAPHTSTIYRRFGSWPRATQLAAQEEDR